MDGWSVKPSETFMSLTSDLSWGSGEGEGPELTESDPGVFIRGSVKMEAPPGPEPLTDPVQSEPVPDQSEPVPDRLGG